MSYTMHYELGDLIDDCTAEGPKQTPDADAKIENLAKTWNPTGFYTPAQIRTLVGSVLTANRGAWDQVELAMSNTIETQMDILRQQVRDLSRVGQQALNYLQAAKEAEAQGASVAAPELKMWVLFSLNTGTQATQVAYVAMCVRPGALALMRMVLGSWAAAVGTVVDVAKKIAGVAVDLVKRTVKAVEGTFDLLGWLMKWGPPATIGLAVLWIVTSSKRNPKAHAA